MSRSKPTTFLALFSLLSLSACSSNPCKGIYGKVGAGYNFDPVPSYQGENDLGIDQWQLNSPYTTEFSAYTKCGRGVSIGGSHQSQPTTGWPFNSTNEYSKNEIFINKEFKIF